MGEHAGQEWYRKELDRRTANIRHLRTAEVVAEDKEAVAAIRSVRDDEEELYERLKKRLFRGE